MRGARRVGGHTGGEEMARSGLWAEGGGGGEGTGEVRGERGEGGGGPAERGGGGAGREGEDVVAAGEAGEAGEGARRPEFGGDEEIGVDAAEQLAVGSEQGKFLGGEGWVGADFFGDPGGLEGEGDITEMVKKAGDAPD